MTLTIANAPQLVIENVTPSWTVGATRSSA